LGCLLIPVATLKFFRRLGKTGFANAVIASGHRQEKKDGVATLTKGREKCITV